MTTPETLPDLKPCPFCGGEPTFVEDPDHSTGCWITHENMKCCIDSIFHWEATRAEAIATWNHRADTRPAPVSGWQPIETAPRDGTAMLLWSHDTHTYPLFGRYWEQDEAWQEDADHTTCQPTHWMPLPAAPGEALSPAPAVEGLLTELRRIATERNCGCTPVCRCFEGENGRYQFEGLQDHILAALAAYEESRK